MENERLREELRGRRIMAGQMLALTGGIVSDAGTIIFNHNPSLMFYARPGDIFFHQLYVTANRFIPDGDSATRTLSVLADPGETFDITLRDGQFAAFTRADRTELWSPLGQGQLDEISGRLISAGKDKIILLSCPADHHAIFAIETPEPYAGRKGSIVITKANYRQYERAAVLVPDDETAEALPLKITAQDFSKPKLPKRPTYEDMARVLLPELRLTLNGTLHVVHKPEPGRDNFELNGREARGVDWNTLGGLAAAGRIPAVPKVRTPLVTPQPLP